MNLRVCERKDLIILLLSERPTESKLIHRQDQTLMWCSRITGVSLFPGVPKVHLVVLYTFYAGVPQLQSDEPFSDLQCRLEPPGGSKHYLNFITALKERVNMSIKDVSTLIEHLNSKEIAPFFWAHEIPWIGSFFVEIVCPQSSWFSLKVMDSISVCTRGAFTFLGSIIYRHLSSHFLLLRKGSRSLLLELWTL